jgi:L,D-peptidoglycan transpeptidase YkuD (ErfK/YbiS/YcfS/YnhG family)
VNNITVFNNHIEFMGKKYQCAIGENGLINEKTEGDKKTPIGKFFLRECY